MLKDVRTKSKVVFVERGATEVELPAIKNTLNFCEDKIIVLQKQWVKSKILESGLKLNLKTKAAKEKM